MGENSTGTFILGLVAGVVLFLLWRKERAYMSAPTSAGAGSPAGTGPSAASCSGGCGGGCGTGGGCFTGPSPSYSVSPSVQNAMASMGLAGQVSPGAPPLGGPSTSFYGTDGPTTDASFTFTPQTAPSGNAPGSATTPAAVTPVRATTPVTSYRNTGFVNYYNVSGVPRSSLRRNYLQ